MTLAATRPWREIALRDIAEAAGTPMTALYGVARSKDDILDAVMTRLDKEASEGLELDRAASVRERVFDAAMARFDAMEKRRAGIVSIVREETARPLGLALMWPRVLRTARWILELAGVDTAGAVGAARTHGFALMLAHATRAWLADDAGDLSRTMATLDRALRDLEAWKERFPRRRNASAAPSAAHSQSGNGESPAASPEAT